MWFYVRNRDRLLRLIKTELVEKRGTWHHWKDADGLTWKSRGEGPTSQSRRSAIAVYVADHPEAAYSCVSMAYEIGNNDGWDEGVSTGKALGKQECRKACPMQQPKWRSFIARLMRGRPFSAA